MAEKNGSSNKDLQHPQLETALRHARINNVILLVMLIVSMSGFVYLNFLWEPVDQIDEDRLMSIAMERVTEHSPTIIAESTELFAEVAPPVTDAFTRQIKADVPVYLRTLEQEGEQLAINMQYTLRDKVRKQFREFLIAHRAVFKEELPEVADDKAIRQLEQEVEQAMDRLIERYYIDDFAQQTKRTQKLWRQFEPLSEPKDDATLEDVLVQYVADWAALRLKDFGETTAAEGLGLGR